MTGETHLAELNIARLKYDLVDPRVGDFVANLDRINAIAERMSGFVWRHVSKPGDADYALSDDPRMIPNLSVWTDGASLDRFVWGTAHKRFYERREKWFGLLDSMQLVMWRIPVGHRPTMAEALERLDDINQSGPSGRAFGWESLADATMWRSHQCGSVAAE